MSRRLSTSAPMPPRMPKISCTNSGVLRARLEEVGELVEVADVVAFELETRAGLAQTLQDVFDVAEVLRKMRSRVPSR